MLDQPLILRFLMWPYSSVAQVINPYRPIGGYRSIESMAAFLDEVWGGGESDMDDEISDISDEPDFSE